MVQARGPEQVVLVVQAQVVLVVRAAAPVVPVAVEAVVKLGMSLLSCLYDAPNRRLMSFEYPSLLLGFFLVVGLPAAA